MARAVPAVSRALDILELFLEDELHAGASVWSSPPSAADIVERLGLPRTTVHELVGTLVDRSYLAAIPGQPTRYQLGVRLFQLGGRFAEHLDLTREAQAVAAQVAHECDETVHVAVLDGTEVVYVAKVDSVHPVRMVSAVGRRLPAHCTAVGKMLLSGLPSDVLAARYPAGSPLPAMTANSITSVPRLRAELTQVHSRGLAYDDCESNDVVRCVAAGVHDHTGGLVAAMSISVPSPRWNPTRQRAWSALVHSGASALSARLGHHTTA